MLLLETHFCRLGGRNVQRRGGVVRGRWGRGRERVVDVWVSTQIDHDPTQCNLRKHTRGELKTRLRRNWCVVWELADNPDGNRNFEACVTVKTLFYPSNQHRLHQVHRERALVYQCLQPVLLYLGHGSSVVNKPY